VRFGYRPITTVRSHEGPSLAMLVSVLISITRDVLSFARVGEQTSQECTEFSADQTWARFSSELVLKSNV
jgi:hypothetical protein